MKLPIRFYTFGYGSMGGVKYLNIQFGKGAGNIGGRTIYIRLKRRIRHSDRGYHYSRFPWLVYTRNANYLWALMKPKSRFEYLHMRLTGQVFIRNHRIRRLVWSMDDLAHDLRSLVGRK